ncbi:Tsc3p ASCRUDRAFT_7288 [Ascoidea rubescens DSM 1968]|uniref:Uncharacterized protein n=1 Tax=Ascoidea rubescens DSM 1968 TaxID=1344418 RepID=A0A1D2VJX4_9ASCO|nr:hypothetical protein ASCRUDRAFT_7288 [Ascoidea rubescens DSM 1968]ODV61807.1 hypothetical protein ASCRUDRAFT_7288 [Ascoidea rubescens DSM 1968]
MAVSSSHRTSSFKPEEYPRHTLSLFDRLCWAYYIHFPFYLMTSGEAFFIHSFMLLFFSLIIYGTCAYLPSYIFYFISRSYYYLTGNDFKVLFKSLNLSDLL